MYEHDVWGAWSLVENGANTCFVHATAPCTKLVSCVIKTAKRIFVFISKQQFSPTRHRNWIERISRGISFSRAFIASLILHLYRYVCMYMYICLCRKHQLLEKRFLNFYHLPVEFDLGWAMNLTECRVRPWQGHLVWMALNTQN